MLKLPMEIWICRTTNEYTEIINGMMMNPVECSWYEDGKCLIGDDYPDEYKNRPRKCDARPAVMQWKKDAK